MKLKRHSRTLWFNGVMGFISLALLGAEFFVDFVREVAPVWVATLLLGLCAINNAANWWLRMRTGSPVK
jgi:hypothetical protein